MDLDAIKFSNNSNRLPNNVWRYYIDNRLCMAYSQPGHWKDAYNFKKNLNPLPMLPRQLPPSYGGFFNRGDGNQSGNYRWGRGFGHRDPHPRFPSLMQPQPMAPYINYGQVLYATANCETGYIISKVPLSIYTLSETDTLGYTS